jgi:hypothetical protein
MGMPDGGIIEMGYEDFWGSPSMNIEGEEIRGEVLADEF